MCIVLALNISRCLDGQQSKMPRCFDFFLSVQYQFCRVLALFLRNVNFEALHVVSIVALLFYIFVSVVWGIDKHYSQVVRYIGEWWLLLIWLQRYLYCLCPPLSEALPEMHLPSFHCKLNGRMKSIKGNLINRATTTYCIIRRHDLALGKLVITNITPTIT